MMTPDECVPGVRVRLNKLGLDPHYGDLWGLDAASVGRVDDPSELAGVFVCVRWDGLVGDCLIHMPEDLEPAAA